MASTITEADIKEIRESAEAGDEAAKAALAAIPEVKEPESGKAEPPSETKVGSEAAQPEAKEAPPSVDQPQEQPERRQRETVHPAVRRIEREKRELRRQLEEQQKQIQALSKRFEETAPRKPEESEADVLNSFLANPRSFLDERDKRIIETARKAAAEENLRNSEEVARRTVERQTALKIISEIEGYDDRRDSEEMVEITSEYLNDVYDTDRYDPEEVIEMWKENPGLLAPVMRKAWKKAKALSDVAKADKRAATSPAAGTGKPIGGKAPTIEELNSKLAKANDRGDKKEANAILDQIADALGEKR